MKTNKIFALLLCLAIMLSITPVISLTVSAKPATSSYTLTVPSTLGIEGAGWNETDGITAVATGDTDFPALQYLLVTAESANEWQLKSESENTIGYVLTTEADGEQTTSWMFRANELDAGTNRAMGVEVEDYSDAPFGSYTDTVVFTASVETLDVLLSKTGEDDTAMLLTDYRDAANNGEYEGWTVNLIHDVDLKGELWTPIECFNGTFDGWDYTISNLKIEAPDGIGAFFKSCADGATIQNVKFSNVDVSAYYAAVVVGQSSGLSMYDVEVLSGTVSSPASYAAGIIFYAKDSLNMINCVNRATVEGWSASGIGAWMYPSSGDIIDLVNYGDVTGANRAGGIFGNWGGSFLCYCENHGAVTSTGNMPAGGIVGVLGGATQIDHCVNTGDVTTTYADVNASAGGILGQTPSSNATITRCINTGDVTAENGVAGGIGVSLYGNITARYCYNSGAVSGNYSTTAAGGIVPKAPFGTADKAEYCLNAGTVTAVSGTAYNVSLQNYTGSYYYDGDTLKTAAGVVVDDFTEALAVLNTDTYGYPAFAYDGLTKKIVPADEDTAQIA